MRSIKPICTPLRLSEVSQRCLWKGSNVRLIHDGLLSSFQGRSSSALSFNAFLLQAINGVMSLALCPQVVSQASQHFRSSEKQATCLGCFARQSIWSVVFLHSGMSRAVHQQEFSKVDVDRQWGTRDSQSPKYTLSDIFSQIFRGLMQSLLLIIYSLHCLHKHICLQSGSVDIQIRWYSSIHILMVKCNTYEFGYWHELFAQHNEFNSG